MLKSLSPFLFYCLLLSICIYSNGCKLCSDDECPSAEKSIILSFVNPDGVDCLSLNPDFATNILNLNNSAERPDLRLQGDQILWSLNPDRSEGGIQLNDSTIYFLNLEFSTIAVECCGDAINVIDQHRLRERGSDEIVCDNCYVLEIEVALCE